MLSTVAFNTQTHNPDRAKKTSRLFDKLSLQPLLELSIPLASEFSPDTSWNSCSAILPWTEVKLNQPSVPRNIPFIFLKYRKYIWQPSNFLEFPLFPKIYCKLTALNRAFQLLPLRFLDVEVTRVWKWLISTTPACLRSSFAISSKLSLISTTPHRMDTSSSMVSNKNPKYGTCLPFLLSLFWYLIN